MTIEQHFDALKRIDAQLVKSNLNTIEKECLIINRGYIVTQIFKMGGLTQLVTGNLLVSPQ